MHVVSKADVCRESVACDLLEVASKFVLQIIVDESSLCSNLVYNHL